MRQIPTNLTRRRLHAALNIHEPHRPELELGEATFGRAELLGEISDKDSAGGGVRATGDADESKVFAEDILAVHSSAHSVIDDQSHDGITWAGDTIKDVFADKTRPPAIALDAIPGMTAVAALVATHATAATVEYVRQGRGSQASRVSEWRNWPGFL